MKVFFHGVIMEAGKVCGPDHFCRPISYQYSWFGDPGSLPFCTLMRSTFWFEEACTRVGCTEKTNGVLTPAPSSPIGSDRRAVKSISRKPSGARKASPRGVGVTDSGLSVPVATPSEFLDRVFRAASPVIW